jgi:hypothetical protein
LKKKKQRKTIKIIPYLAFILVTDNCSTTKIKKKRTVVMKGLKGKACQIALLFVCMLPIAAFKPADFHKIC